MLLGFMFAFGGMVIFIVVGVLASASRSVRPRGGLTALLEGTPTRLGAVLLGLVACAIVSAIAGLITTGGYSQDLENAQPNCHWPIVTDHGATVLCVSHDRWLRTGQGFEHAFLGFIAVFTSLECAGLAADIARRTEPSH